MNQTRQNSSRTGGTGESDAMAIIGMFAIGILSVMMVVVLGARILMNLPPVFAAAIAFSLIVFGIACGAALLRRKEVPRASSAPTVLVFRKHRGRIR